MGTGESRYGGYGIRRRLAPESLVAPVLSKRLIESHPSLVRADTPALAAKIWPSALDALEWTLVQLWATPAPRILCVQPANPAGRRATVGRGVAIPSGGHDGTGWPAGRTLLPPTHCPPAAGPRLLLPNAKTVYCSRTLSPPHTVRHPPHQGYLLLGPCRVLTVKSGLFRYLVGGVLI